MDWTLDIPLAISRGQFDYRSPSDSTSIASKFLGPQRLVEPGISLTDLPVIDIVIISHNHYDHLDPENCIGFGRTTAGKSTSLFGATRFERLVR